MILEFQAVFLAAKFSIKIRLEDTDRYAGQLLAPAEAFFALWANKVPNMLIWPFLDHYRCPVVTLEMFSSKL